MSKTQKCFIITNNSLPLGLIITPINKETSLLDLDSLFGLLCCYFQKISFATSTPFVLSTLQLSSICFIYDRQANPHLLTKIKILFIFPDLVTRCLPKSPLLPMIRAVNRVRQRRRHFNILRECGPRKAKYFKRRDNTETFLFNVDRKERHVPLCLVITPHRTLNIIAPN